MTIKGIYKYKFFVKESLIYLTFESYSTGIVGHRWTLVTSDFRDHLFYQFNWNFHLQIGIVFNIFFVILNNFVIGDFPKIRARLNKNLNWNVKLLNTFWTSRIENCLNRKTLKIIHESNHRHLFHSKNICPLLFLTSR